MRVHRIATLAMVDLGYSSKLNAEWDFLTFLRDEGRRTADAFLAAHGDDMGRRSSFDIDGLLESWAPAPVERAARRATAR